MSRFFILNPFWCSSKLTWLITRILLTSLNFRYHLMIFFITEIAKRFKTKLMTYCTLQLDKLLLFLIIITIKV